MLYQETMLLLHPSYFMEEVMTVFDFDLDQSFDFDQSNLDFDHSNFDFDQSNVDFDPKIQL
jgi:hypothetical protein